MPYSMILLPTLTRRSLSSIWKLQLVAICDFESMRTEQNSDSVRSIRNGRLLLSYSTPDVSQKIPAYSTFSQLILMQITNPRTPTLTTPPTPPPCLHQSPLKRSVFPDFRILRRNFWIPTVAVINAADSSSIISQTRVRIPSPMPPTTAP